MRLVDRGLHHRDAPDVWLRCSLAAVHALKTMFDSGHFNICVVRNVLDLAGVHAGGPDWKALEALHCVDWGDMGPELAAEVKLKTLQLFEAQPDQIDKEVIENVFSNNTLLLQ